MFVWKPFFECNVIFRAVVGCTGLLLCLVGICNLVLSWRQKKKHFLCIAIPILCMGDVTVQTCRTMGGLAELPAGLWISLLLFFSGVSVWLSIANLGWRRNHITPLSIQESFEKLTEGLCFYREDGQCILVNGRMHEICRELTGHMLLNGREFEEFLFGESGNNTLVPMPGERTLSCRHRELGYHGDRIHEVIASDVTEQYAKTLQLKARTERMKEFSHELREYNVGIQDMVRREEILRAKMNIHDEMNRLLLFSKNAISEGEEEKKKALLAWKSNALLLCKETEGSEGGSSAIREALRDLEAMAKSLKCVLVCVGTSDRATEKAVRLFVLATREALNNAVKHAGARHLFVALEEDEAGMKVSYTNDHAENHSLSNRESAGNDSLDNRMATGIGAKLPGNMTGELGGLKNLRQKLEEAGGEMEITAEPEYRLRIWIPY